ncbi:MAG: hypothetical protein JRD88_00535 [Deltaproteobacteria bacterium]|nr:hypothetical protein [Deltaproteobacteria bacterium]
MLLSTENCSTDPPRLLLRTNLPPNRRGLSPAELEGVFFMSPDYPVKVREAIKSELGDQWFGGIKR